MSPSPAPLSPPPVPRRLALAVALVLAAGLTACSGCSAQPDAGTNPTAENRAAASPAPGDDLPLDGEYRPVEVTTVGWDRLSASPVVLLRELQTGQIVPIWVGVAEARAIASALHEVDYPRPMTHDLMANLLGKLDARLDELLIHDVVGGTYYGLLRLHLEGPGNGAGGNGHGEPVLVDTRPSDGLALALRAGAAIRVSQQILDETPDVDFSAPDEPDQVVRALGLTVVAPTAELREEHGIPEERGGLVVIRAVGNAADSGLRRGDLLVSVADEAVSDPVGFLDAVRGLPFGEPVTLRYWRDGAEREVEVTPELELPTRPEEGEGQVA